MDQNNYHLIGVMSGTSLDGIDLAEIFLTWSSDTGWKFKMIAVETVPYSNVWKSRLQEAVHYSKERLQILDEDYTDYLAVVISDFIKKNEIDHLDVVCSHGHTVLHQPKKRITLQIGNLPKLAKLIAYKVICDFRKQDVALGGQGAPLVPIGDRLLFSEYDYCLNLGGFANISSEIDGRQIAFDICPVNIVLNYLAEQLGKPFDDEGEFAATGIIDKDLLSTLNDLDYYSYSAPKSLGLEWVQKHIFPLLKDSSLDPRDILRTYTEHVAIQIAAQIKKGANMLLSGGGVYNSFLLKRIKMLSDVNIVIPSKEIIEYKEALIFALLGVLKLRNEVNTLASVTGAERDHSSGLIYK